MLALFADFLSPFGPEQTKPGIGLQPPQPLYLFDYAPELVWDPHVIVPVFKKDQIVGSRKIELGFFVRGFEYRFLGLVPCDLHLWGARDRNEVFFVLGSDRGGHDILSRTLYGARFTLSLALLSAFLSVLIGLGVGIASAYSPRWLDWSILRFIEHIFSLPAIPIWLAMVAALPRPWPPHYQYFAVALAIALVGWTHQARVTRRHFLLMQEAPFVKAARLDGCSEFSLVFRHMLPVFLPHLAAAFVLAFSAMILAETTLSFLGLGLQAPAVSWGVLLKEAQDLWTILSSPCVLFVPGFMVVVTVLSLSFLGEGLRQAAESYEH